jgi:Taurine catabolism dioxygenase TauD, TfdA family
MTTILHQESAGAGPVPPALGANAWTRASLTPEAGRLALQDDVLEEIERLAAELEANPLPLPALDPDDFALPACRALMAEAKQILERGVGFVVLDRLPVERLGTARASAVYWLLGSMLARPVAQNWAEGRLLYDVRDSGKTFGYGVRPDITNRHQNFHTDNSYNLMPPRYVGLLCLQVAEQGGISGLASLVSAHEEMRRRAPDLLARLYRPFLFDRQNEHAPGAEKVLSHALFEAAAGEFRGRLSRGRTLAGYELAGETPDEAGLAALDMLESILEDPNFNCDFVFQPGQMQFVHNLWCGHRRTAFRDGPGRQRHLLRLWLRDEGRRFYNG